MINKNWNGKWIPPVGTICEIALRGSSYRECEIVAVTNIYVIVRFTSNGLERALGHMEAYFKSINTSKEISIGALERVWENETMMPAVKFEILYDAIANGYIPGVKLDETP